MATGIEAASLALAVLPLLVNQLEAYVRGIEKIKLLRHYRSQFAQYSVKLGAQRVILLDTLEQVLKGVVKDNDKVSKLLLDPRGQGWKDLSLQERLRNKLGRSYDPFVGIMTELSGLLNRLSERMSIHEADIEVTYEANYKISCRLIFTIGEKSRQNQKSLEIKSACLGSYL